MTLDRRGLLASLATLAIAGCTGPDGAADPDSGGEADPTANGEGDPDSEGSNETDRPAECPTTQGLDVEWPTDLDAAAVESFVETYEYVYYRDVVVEYEPESRLDSEALSATVTEGPREVDGGYELGVSGGGAIYRPTLWIRARVTDASTATEPIPAGEFDGDALRDLFIKAVEEGEAELHVEPPGEEVERYLDRFEARSTGFSLSGQGDSERVYVDLDGTLLEVVVQASGFHGDYWWEAWYYVDEQVLRRSTESDTDPRDGRLLECRPSD